MAFCLTKTLDIQCSATSWESMTGPPKHTFIFQLYIWNQGLIVTWYIGLPGSQRFQFFFRELEDEGYPPNTDVSGGIWMSSKIPGKKTIYRQVITHFLTFYELPTGLPSIGAHRKQRWDKKSHHPKPTEVSTGILPGANLVECTSDLTSSLSSS